MIALVSVLCAVSLCKGGSESYGRWDDESRAKYTMLFMDYLLKEQKQRNAMLKESTPDHVVDLKYKYFNLPADSEIEEAKAKMLEGRLNRKLTGELITGMLKDLQVNKTLLYVAEEKAFKIWKPKTDSGVLPTKKKEAKLIGEQVQAINIGVVLDNSQSMKEYIKALRDDVVKGFSYHEVIEVGACSFESYYGKNAWFFADPPAHMNPFDAKWHSPKELKHFVRAPYQNYINMMRDSRSAIEALVMKGVDTVYWLSDFKDSRNKRIAGEVAELLKKNKVRLYMHTVKTRPRKDPMVEYAKETGSVKRVKLPR